MTAYTVKQLAELAGVSVRTLHHYDHIGLLRPSARTRAGYRLYQRGDLLRLQQILFFKELDFALAEIGDILDDPDFDEVKALEDHRRLLEQRANRIALLINTIDKTIHERKENTMPLTDAELYEGFTDAEIQEMKREVHERYDPELVKIANQNVRNMSKAQWQAVKNEGEAVTLAIAALQDRDPSDPEVQKLMARHHAHMENFYPVSAEIYKGLGQMYVMDERFTAFYEKISPGLAEFMRDAMAYYAEHTLSV